MFKIDSSSKYIICGASEKGFKIANLLKTKGLTISAFIDRNQSLECDTPIINLDDLAKIDDKKSFIIIISFQNALEHEKTANTIRKYGFTHILFFPMLANNESKSQILRDSLNQIFLGSIPSNNIYTYDELYKNDQLNNIQISNDGFITIMMPFEYIYTDNNLIESKDKYAKNRLKTQKKYLNKPLIFFKPYFEMINYITLGKGNCKEYITMQLKGIQPYSVQYKKIISDRKKLLNLYELKYNLQSLLFFISSPSDAKWNKNGFFNLTDGHHRACYLLSKGFTDVPIKVSKEDFDLFLNYLQPYLLLENLLNESSRILSPIKHSNISKGLEYKLLISLISNSSYENFAIKRIFCMTRFCRYLPMTISKFTQNEILVYSELKEYIADLSELPSTKIRYLSKSEELFSLIIVDDDFLDKLDSFEFEELIYISKKKLMKNTKTDFYSKYKKKLLLTDVGEDIKYYVYFLRK